MTRYWVVRSKRSEAGYFYRELQSGRLRQGWGYRDDQNLDHVRDLVAHGIELSPEQKDCWSGNRRLHPSESDSIQDRDYIISPNLPEPPFWCVSEATGDYHFEIDPELGDFGHFREVKLLCHDRCIHPNNRNVSAKLRQTMRSQSRMWCIDKYALEMEKLIRALKAGEDVSEPEQSAEKLQEINNVLTRTLEDALREKYHGHEFESPVTRMLEQVYDNVISTGGPTEKGADLVCEFTDQLGVLHRLVIQVKMWEKQASDIQPLRQIENAIRSYAPVSAGVVLTTAESCSDGFERERERLEAKYGIPVRLVFRDELLAFFLRYCPDIVPTADASC